MVTHGSGDEDFDIADVVELIVEALIAQLITETCRRVQKFRAMLMNTSV